MKEIWRVGCALAVTEWVFVEFTMHLLFFFFLTETPDTKAELNKTENDSIWKCHEWSWIYIHKVSKDKNISGPYIHISFCVAQKNWGMKDVWDELEMGDINI